MEYFLGLDGGGTKTASVIIDAFGAEIGRGLGGPCNIAVTPIDEITNSVLEAVSAALKSAGLPQNTTFTSTCAGVAGFTSRGKREEFNYLLPRTVNTKSARAEADFTIAYWGASGGEPGLMISAGTGTVFFCRDANGSSSRFDGLGYIIGDHGSGFQIGQNALRIVATQLLSLTPTAAFVAEIMKAIGGNQLDDLIEWTYRDFSTGKIASLVPHIVKLAESGDEVAHELLLTAAVSLRSGALLTLNRLGMDPQSASMFPLGSLFRIPIIRNRFEGIGEEDQFQLKEPRNDAAYGAALLAKGIDQSIMT